MRGPRAFLHVTHLLGIGHLSRAVAIARALAAMGGEAVIASGGSPVPLDLPEGVRLQQLPPARTRDETFLVLVDETGKPIDGAWLDARRQATLEAFDDAAPDILITELFPFGRWKLRAEALALLEHARAKVPRPLILASVRDILVRSKIPRRAEMQAGWARDLYDGVLIHGDPDFIRLDETFPETRLFAGRHHYTGYVVDRAATPVADKAGHGEVIVSAGGGAVGAGLIEAALAARTLLSAEGPLWRVLVGWNVPEAEFARIQASAPPGLVVERARGDFPALLERAAVSVSQAGYNTVAEALVAGAPMVLVPFAGGKETEQPTRARALAARGLAEVIPEETLKAEDLAGAVTRALKKGRGTLSGLRFDGAEESARITLDLLKTHRGA